MTIDNFVLVNLLLEYGSKLCFCYYYREHKLVFGIWKTKFKNRRIGIECKICNYSEGEISEFCNKIVMNIIGIEIGDQNVL